MGASNGFILPKYSKKSTSWYTSINMINLIGVKTEKIDLLIEEAKQKMRRCLDPAHDLNHAARVARFAAQLAADTSIPPDQKTALILAAWWHDVSRTLTKNPSLIWMPFFDDLLSAFMLWLSAIRHGLFGSAAGMATRLIMCKSLGTGAVLTQLLVRHRHRLLIDLLKDADTLDVVNFERLQKLMPFVESYRRYYWAYKTLVRWFVSTHYLHMKTQAARVYVIKLLRAFLAWVKDGATYIWHLTQFGEKWCARMFRRAENLLQRIE